MKHALAIAALALAAGCATEPKPCTAEWLDWKTGRFLDEFARDHRKDIIDLRDVTAAYDKSGEKPDMATIAVAGVEALALTGAFLGETVPKVNDAVAQCGTTLKATQLFASLLRREGFSERAAKAVEDLGPMMDRGN
jgi:hypothetical protein